MNLEQLKRLVALVEQGVLAAVGLTPIFILAALILMVLDVIVGIFDDGAIDLDKDPLFVPYVQWVFEQFSYALFDDGDLELLPWV